jgi:hypothetical protein
MSSNSPFAVFMDKTGEALEKAYGFQWRVANVMDQILSKHGFVNIGCKKYKAPMGKWPKVSRNRLRWLPSMQAYSP